MEEDIIISAVIFDMDGLMFDTERIAQKCWEQAAADLGFTYSPTLYRNVIGRNHADVKRITQEFLGSSASFEEIFQKKQTYFDQHCDHYGLPRKAGLNALLSYLDKISLPIAVASSSPRNQILKNLISVGLSENQFRSIIGGDSVKYGKPDPEIFIKVAVQLNIPVKNCLVLEDSNTGIQAAFAAGMIPVMVPDIIEPTPQSREIAFCILNSLHEVVPLIKNHRERKL